jgi:hypothetical protein
VPAAKPADATPAAKPVKPDASAPAGAAESAATFIDAHAPALSTVEDKAKEKLAVEDKAKEKLAAKIKIGDKEYTTEELEQALAARSSQPSAAPAAVPAPVPAVPVKQATPEEIAASENKWAEDFVVQEKLSVPITEKEMESILAGDKDGVALLSGKLNSVVAKAVMLARKSIYQELNPILGGLQANLQPVFQNAQQVEAAAAEHEFFTAYPDFKTHSETVHRVGEALLTRFPNECRAMTRQQLLAEVAAQSDRIIQAECQRYAPGKNWRTLQAAAPAAPAAAPAAPAAAPAAPVVKVLAPSANSPAAVPSGGVTNDWNKKTAASLTD